jgi:hypothetical protein
MVQIGYWSALYGLAVIAVVVRGYRSAIVPGRIAAWMITHSA